MVMNLVAMKIYGWLLYGATAYLSVYERIRNNLYGLEEILLNWMYIQKA